MEAFLQSTTLRLRRSGLQCKPGHAALKSVLRERFPNYWSQIDSSEPIWQARDYGFNIRSRSKVEEKPDDMHLNPVWAGLVQ